MKLVLEASGDADSAVELEKILLVLQRLNFIVASRKLADGSYLVEVDDEEMASTLFESSSVEAGIVKVFTVH